MWAATAALDIAKPAPTGPPEMNPTVPATPMTITLPRKAPSAAIVSTITGVLLNRYRIVYLSSFLTKWMKCLLRVHTVQELLG